MIQIYKLSLTQAMLIEDKDQENLNCLQNLVNITPNMITINQIKKKQTIEIALYVVNHGHTRMVKVCAQHWVIIVKDALNKITQKEKLKTQINQVNKVENSSDSDE